VIIAASGLKWRFGWGPEGANSNDSGGFPHPR
jgi:hypothetical protein